MKKLKKIGSSTFCGQITHYVESVTDLQGLQGRLLIMAVMTTENHSKQVSEKGAVLMIIAMCLVLLTSRPVFSPTFFYDPPEP
uniref:Uncharacterized protein n=1 Tax=Anguilla anguilla TaxID=7936 RepID=A0A0E9P9P2_ANGAN